MSRSNAHESVVKDLFSITTTIDKDAISNAENIAKILLIAQDVLPSRQRPILMNLLLSIITNGWEIYLGKMQLWFRYWRHNRQASLM